MTIPHTRNKQQQASKRVPILTIGLPSTDITWCCNALDFSNFCLITSSVKVFIFGFKLQPERSGEHGKEITGANLI